MPKFYNIKSSPGKGQGVFANRAIPSGTTILQDRILLRIDVDGPKSTEDDVLAAFNQLKLSDKNKFLALHEGTRQYASKEFRIFKGNAFGDDDSSDVYDVVSRLNHSCVPNAELHDVVLTSGKKEEVEVIATRPIAKGEEIFISYNPRFVGLIKRHRNNILRVYYGFECSCRACSLSTEEQVLSDMRRQLINHFFHALAGCETEDMKYYDLIGTLSAADAEHPAVLNGVQAPRRDAPLTDEQEIVYNLFLARLLEPEDYVCEQVAEAYNNSAYGLLTLVDQNEDLVVLPAARNVQCWMEAAIAVMRKVSGANGPKAKELQERWEMWKEGNQMRTALHIFERRGAMAKVFALHLDGTFTRAGKIGLKVNALTEAQCNAWVLQNNGGFF